MNLSKRVQFRTTLASGAAKDSADLRQFPEESPPEQNGSPLDCVTSHCPAMSGRTREQARQARVGFQFEVRKLSLDALRKQFLPKDVLLKNEPFSLP